MIACMNNRSMASRAVLAVALVTVVVASSIPTTSFAAPGGTPKPWLDVKGEPLPFQGHAEIQKALESATMLHRTTIDRPGLEGLEMLLLEAEGAQFYAMFRAKSDTSVLELAAYEIDRMLGLDHVPPVVARSIEGVEGVLQIWRQHAGTEIEVAEAGQLIPASPRRFRQQRQAMYLFDSLIANPGRSEANTLIDTGWHLWFIDHSGAFKATTKILHEVELTKCDEDVWRRFKDLDRDELEERMAPYLDEKQRAKLAKRHRALVKHFQRMIDAFGEDVVLY
jgi:hypothetical protein